MKESSATSADDNQLQFIASQHLLNALVTSFFRSELFLTHFNPYMNFQYFYYDNSTDPPTGIECTTALLAFQFPNIGYDGYKCRMQLWFKNITAFQINTGRFYTKANEMTIGMNITVYNGTNATDMPYNISMEVPMDNLYIQFKMENSKVNYQIFNF
jgi:hypothetical protein